MRRRGRSACSVPGCHRPMNAKGFCKTHGRRLADWGDVRPDVPVLDHSSLSEMQRWVSKVAISHDPAGCWLWQGSINPCGYGQFRTNQFRSHQSRGDTVIRAHRYAYLRFIGPIPEGLHLDHLCRVRSCVNPAHLEAVTNKENGLRGVGAGALNARKTHCPKGHPYSGDNVILEPRPWGFSRRCRACRAVNDGGRRRDGRRRAAIDAARSGGEGAA